jgi:hypothetical protein
MLISGITMLSLVSCTKDLNLVPTNDITASTVYSTPEGFRSGLAKVYGSFALTGNTGGVGSPDISTQIISDEGNSDFLRMYFNLQELTTDEAPDLAERCRYSGSAEMSWSSIKS